MSRIKGRNTKPELLIRKFLYSKGVRYRIHAKLPGKPDITISKKKIVIFVNGCFWHKHQNCKYYVEPKTNTAFWVQKINGNVERDKANYKKHKNEGWKIIIIWECEIEKNFEKVISKLLKELITETGKL